MGRGNGGSSISDIQVTRGLDVKHPGFLALCIRRTPVLWVKICVKKCVLYTRNYGKSLFTPNWTIHRFQGLVFPELTIISGADTGLNLTGAKTENGRDY